MLTSARNTLKGVVKEVHKGAINSEIELSVGSSVITAIVTNDSVKTLGLTKGVNAFALVKASSVIVAMEKPSKISARNILEGRVSEVKKGAVNGEVIIDVGEASLASIITLDAINELDIKKGDTIFAIIKASSVIVGVN